MPLTTDILLRLAANLTKADDLVTGASPLNIQKTIALANGTGANQASQMFSDQRTLAASATENLDLAGALLNIFGATITFNKIKAIYISAAAGNVNDVLVGGHATAAFVGPFGAAADKLRIKPGGAALLVAPDVNGYAVVAGTGDMLTVANSGAGTSVTYDIALIGTE